MRREEIVATFERYVQRFQLPVQYGTRVNAVESLANGDGYRVRTDDEVLEARKVVVATGLYQRPKIPAFRTELPAHITQLHSGHYRNPQALPPGAVLVVGSGQSGCQIAEELYYERAAGVSVRGQRRARPAPLPRQGCVPMDANDRIPGPHSGQAALAQGQVRRQPASVRQQRRAHH